MELIPAPNLGPPPPPPSQMATIHSHTHTLAWKDTMRKRGRVFEFGLAHTVWYGVVLCPIFEFRILRTCRKGKHINYMLSFFPLIARADQTRDENAPEIAVPYFQRARHHSSQKCSIFFQK